MKPFNLEAALAAEPVKVPSDAELLTCTGVSKHGDMPAIFGTADIRRFAECILKHFGQRPAEPDEWKLAVDHELTFMQSTADSYPSAKEAVKALINWHVAVATDPVFQQPTEPVDTDLVQRWQREHGVVLTPGTREAAMVVIRHDEDGKPTVWCDPEIADLVRALNDGGVATVASCSGHGHRPGNIMLADGRVLVVCKDADEAREVASYFPGINGEAPQPAEPVKGPSDSDLLRSLLAERDALRDALETILVPVELIDFLDAKEHHLPVEDRHVLSIMLEAATKFGEEE